MIFENCKVEIVHQGPNRHVPAWIQLKINRFVPFSGIVILRKKPIDLWIFTCLDINSKSYFSTFVGLNSPIIVSVSSYLFVGDFGPRDGRLLPLSEACCLHIVEECLLYWRISTFKFIFLQPYLRFSLPGTSVKIFFLIDEGCLKWSFLPWVQIISAEVAKNGKILQISIFEIIILLI